MYRLATLHIGASRTGGRRDGQTDRQTEDNIMTISRLESDAFDAW